MVRTRRNPSAPPYIAPIDQAMIADQEDTADQLSAILEAIAPFDAGTVKGVLYQKPRAGQGSYKWIDEVYPPFDLSAIYQDLKENYGGGDYQLRVFAAGKPRKNHDFTIIGTKPAAPAPATSQGMTNIDLIQFMLAQQAESRRDATLASERQAQLFNNLVTAVVPALIPLLAGRRDQPSETVALITALQGRQAGGGLKDTLEAMAAFKSLLGDPGGQGEGAGPRFDPDDLAASAVGLIGPGLKAVSDFLARERPGAAPAAVGDPRALSLGTNPDPGQLALTAPPSRFRIIELVRHDVAYMFARGFDPEKVADLVYDIIVANSVTEDEVNALALQFALSPTGLDDLAAEGIDLRSRPDWARDFFASLATIHQQETTGGDGGDGGPPDLGGNGAPGANGAQGPAHPQPGG